MAGLGDAFEVEALSADALVAVLQTLLPELEWSPDEPLVGAKASDVHLQHRTETNESGTKRSVEHTLVLQSERDLKPPGSEGATKFVYCFGFLERFQYESDCQEKRMSATGTWAADEELDGYVTLMGDAKLIGGVGTVSNKYENEEPTPCCFRVKYKLTE